MEHTEPNPAATNRPRAAYHKIARIRQAPAKELKAFEKRDQITKIMVADLGKRGTFVHSPNGLFYFLQEKERPKLFSLDEDSIALTAAESSTTKLRRTTASHGRRELLLHQLGAWAEASSGGRSQAGTVQNES